MRVDDTAAERLWRAESLIDLFGKMDPGKLPFEEGRALGECQAQAVEDWLSAYNELRARSQ
jgi:hypothetical protein